MIEVVLENRATFCYYNIGSFYHNIRQFSFYKLWQILLQGGVGITEWEDYSKVGYNIHKWIIYHNK